MSAFGEVHPCASCAQRRTLELPKCTKNARCALREGHLASCARRNRGEVEWVDWIWIDENGTEFPPPREKK